MKKCVFLTMAAALLFSGSAIAQGFPDVYYYKFDTGAGTNVINWANASVAPYWHNGVGGLWDPNSANAGLGTAMDFASQDFLHVGPGAGIDTSQSYTIEMQMRTNTVNPFLVRLWSDYSIGTFRCYVSFYNSGNSADYTGGHLNGVGMNPGTGAAVDDGNWHHIALVHDAVAGTITSYVDGVLDYGPFPCPPGGAGTDGLLGGNDQAGGAQNVAVDEFRVWQSARTQTEIVNNMNITLSPPQATPVFTATPVSGATPLIVSFTDLSITPDPGGITNWAWDFENDGIIDDTTQNPCHAFTSANTAYDVTLTIGDATGTVSATYVGYINTGNPDFVMGTCGNGDLYIGAPAPPPNWPMGADGFTVISSTLAGPVGSGSFFGMWFDTITLWGLLQPATPGNPLHFVNTGGGPIFPFTALSFPAGLFVPGSGVGFDAVVVYRDSLGLILIHPVTNLPAISGIARIVF